jgi:microcystin-dependent protein
MSFIPKSDLPQTSLHVLPTGTVISFSGNSCPIGWRFCNGEELNVNDYMELFNVIGHRYGGSGTKFKLPNLNGRVVVGQDTNRSVLLYTYQNTLGEEGGELQHLLTEAEMPEHRHRVYFVFNTKGAGGNPSHYDFLDENNSTGYSTTNVAGGGNKHNIMQPYLVLNYIIKTNSSQWRETNIVTYTPISYNSPLGTIVSTAASSVPSGWLLCDGASYSRTLYPELSELLGTQWGGDTDSFNVPDLRGRTLVGSDGGTGRITTNNTLASVGGEEKHQLNILELPTHNHTVFGDPYHTQGGPYPTLEASSNGSSSFTTDIGSDTPHNNLQPYAVVNYIIKASTEIESASYSFVSTDSTILSEITYFIDASSGTKNIYLSSSYPDNSKVTLRKIDSSINTVIIRDQGSLQIELSATYTLSGSQPITILKTTNGWFITQL